VVMLAHQIITTVTDDSFYTFHRRHASPQLCRVRMLVVNIGYSADDDDDDNDNHNKSFPKSFGKSHVAIPHGREWTRPLHVLLSVQCPLQASPITQPPVRYIHTEVPRAIHYIALSVPPKK